jgi:hypothetical protein
VKLAPAHRQFCGTLGSVILRGNPPNEQVHPSTQWGKLPNEWGKASPRWGKAPYEQGKSWTCWGKFPYEWGRASPHWGKLPYERESSLPTGESRRTSGEGLYLLGRCQLVFFPRYRTRTRHAFQRSGVAFARHAFSTSSVEHTRPSRGKIRVIAKAWSSARKPAMAFSTKMSW